MTGTPQPSWLVRIVYVIYISVMSRNLRAMAKFIRVLCTEIYKHLYYFTFICYNSQSFPITVNVMSY